MQQTQMVICPHCGTSNSAKRRLCFTCQQDLVAPVEPKISVTKRVLRPRTTPDPVQDIEITATPASQAQTEEQARPQQTTATPAAQAQIQPKFRPPQTTATPARTTGTPRTTAKSPTGEPQAQPTTSPLLSVTLKNRAQMYRQFYSLLKTGVPVGLSVSYLEKNCSLSLRPMLREIGPRVLRGELLSEVMGSYPNVFPEWERSMVKAGEKGGTMPEAMQDIAETLETEIKMRSEVNGKTLYLKITSVFFILVMLIVAATQRASLAGGGFPAVMAQLEAAFTTFIGFLGLAIGLFIAWKIWTRTRQGSQFAFLAASKMPVIGPIMKNQMRLRFIRVLAALWHAGVAPIEALETAARASGNPFIIRQVTEKAGDLGKGSTLSEVLDGTVVLPPEAVYLLKSGETSGTIVEALGKSAEYIEIELQSQIRTLPVKMQFIFYAIIGIPIAWFVIKFWLDYFAPIIQQLDNM